MNSIKELIVGIIANSLLGCYLWFVQYLFCLSIGINSIFNPFTCILALMILQVVVSVIAGTFLMISLKGLNSFLEQLREKGNNDIRIISE